MKVATARYWDAPRIKASGLAPVVSTVGFPKFSPGYNYAGLSPHVAPRGIFGKDLTEAQFRKQYRKRLDSFGPARILSLLEAIADAEGADGVVLLCFCDLSKGYCHRRLFAEWWEETTGQVVEELAPIQVTLEVIDGSSIEADPMSAQRKGH